MDRPQQVETLPLQKVSPDSNLMIRDVAKVQPGTAPGEIDRSAMQRYLSITANIEGEDLGRATRRIERAIADAGEPPRGVRVERPRPGRPDGRDVRVAVPSAWPSRWW